MKKLILLILAVSFSLNLFAQNHFTFSGKISGGHDVHIDLLYINSQGKRVIDSCALQGETFSFRGEINGPQMVSLMTYKGHFKSKSDDDPTNFFLEPGKITAIGGSYKNLKKLKITGSKVQDEYEAFEKQLKHLDEKKQEDKIRQYIITHPNSYVSAFQLSLYSTSWPLNSVKNLYSKFNPALQKSMYGKEIQKEITSIDNSAVNKKAINFNSIDINGKLIRLSDFKGRYVLIDFWASWCVPCRESTPHLKKLFNKYNKAGLDVIAVADDDNNQNDWKKAVVKDKTEAWHNVLDGTVRANNETDNSRSISNQYAIYSLPTRVLIDKNGIIIGRYEGTESAIALDRKLAAIFN